jgi:hypothetical protein
MRKRSWILAAALIGLASPAAGHQSGCTECNRGASAGAIVSADLGGEARCTRPGYSLAPGCCEQSRRCCDNAWAGYCEHRAKVEAFWARVGVPKSHVRAAACRQAPTVPCDADSARAVEPTPAIPPASVSRLPSLPATEKATRKPVNPGLR